VLVGFGGTESPRIQSAFVGVLLAPRVLLRLPATPEPHRGSFIAREIVVDDGAEVEHWGFFVGSAQ
jgi:hypothetical protein